MCCIAWVSCLRRWIGKKSGNRKRGSILFFLPRLCPCRGDIHGLMIGLCSMAAVLKGDTGYFGVIVSYVYVYALVF